MVHDHDLFGTSSHVLAFVSGRVLMLHPAVGESSPFMPCQVCLWSSLFQVKSVFVWISHLYINCTWVLHYARIQWNHYNFKRLLLS